MSKLANYPFFRDCWYCEAPAEYVRMIETASLFVGVCYECKKKLMLENFQVKEVK